MIRGTKGKVMIDANGLLTVDVTYQQVDRIGAVPQIDEAFPCEEAPRGVLLIVEKTSLIRGGRRVGWRVEGRI